MERKKFMIIVLLCLMLLLSFTLSVLFGSVSVRFSDILKSLLSFNTGSTSHTLVTAVRLPRAIGGLFAGMGLSVSGIILQSVMNNSLAGPSTIGINSGSGFCIMLAMLLFPQSGFLLPLSAFLGAFTASLAVFLLAYLADSSRTTIILAGITISSFLNADIYTIKILDTELSVNLVSFMAGSLSGLTMTKLFLPCLGILTALILSFSLCRALNILSLGEDTARSLGLNVPLIRLVFLLLASLLAGCVVSFGGLISFVGLVVPHICRQLFGSDARFLLPCSSLLGGSLVLICDLAGRVLFRPFELPVGILTSLIGGPFFLYLLLKKKGGRRVNA